MIKAVEEGLIQKKKGKGRHLFLGRPNLFNSLPRQLFCTRTILKNGINSSFSLNHPGAKHPILQIAGTILKNRITASFSLNHPGLKHTIFQIVLVHNSLRVKEWNTVNCVPHTEARTFAFFQSLSLFYGWNLTFGTYSMRRKKVSIKNAFLTVKTTSNRCSCAVQKCFPWSNASVL